MRFVIAILFIGILARHVIPNWIWQGTGISQAGWFYIFGGGLEVLFCLVFLYVVKNFKKISKEWESLLKIEHAFLILFIKYIIIIGISEGLQISVCRLAISKISDVPQGVNLCDFAAAKNFNYFVHIFSPSIETRNTLPIGQTIWSVYLFSFLYYGAQIIKKFSRPLK